jgi:uncharacterized protein GlcG (DUF336 family)
MTSSLTLQQALAVIDGALAAARHAGHAPMAVAVLDAGGHLQAMHREDGASWFRSEIAQGKAWAALGMGVSSRNLFERAQKNPTFFTSLAATSQGRFIAQTGAILVKDAHGTTIAAVGASGGTGDEDEAICLAGIRAAGFDFA